MYIYFVKLYMHVYYDIWLDVLFHSKRINLPTFNLCKFLRMFINKLSRFMEHSTNKKDLHGGLNFLLFKI